MADATTILIAEDDEDISSLLGRGFALEGYGVDFARTGTEALDRGKSNDYRAIILDVILPELSGIDVCRQLRVEGRESPIIMLSACDSVADRVRGLSAGADDYVVKPFAFEELLARVRSQERRQAAQVSNGPAQVPVATKLTAGDYTLDTRMRTVTKGGLAAELTEREAELLAMLMHHTGEPLTRAEIFQALWEAQGGASINVVDVYVGYLRRKFEVFGAGGKIVIRTVRGVGFMFRA
jgi:DNA-binding response OmpR family regulator